MRKFVWVRVKVVERLIGMFVRFLDGSRAKYIQIQFALFWFLGVQVHRWDFCILHGYRDRGRERNNRGCNYYNDNSASRKQGRIKSSIFSYQRPFEFGVSAAFPNAFKNGLSQSFWNLVVRRGHARLSLLLLARRSCLMSRAVPDKRVLCLALCSICDAPV